MIGCGTVGQGVAQILSQQKTLYTRRLGTELALQRILVRDAKRTQQCGKIDPSIVTTNPDEFFTTPNIGIIIEVAGGRGLISQYVRRALSDGKHVVTANKSLLAAEGSELFSLAHENRVSIAFEASCGGGIPIITALQFGLMANKINAMYGILNGTCNYILTEMTQSGKCYSEALSEAQEHGFAEADPTLDVSGQDAAEKLAILSSLAFGIQATSAHVQSEGIDQLNLTDIKFGSELGYDIKLLAIAERNNKSDDHVSLRVHPCFVHTEIPLAQVHGPFNALSVYGHATGQTLYYGRGAGQMPTASAVVSDVINIASGWYPHAFGELKLWSNDHGKNNWVNPDDLPSRFYLRISARDTPGVVAKVGTILGDAGISVSALLQHEVDADKFVPVVITTHSARQGAMNKALAEIGRLEVINGQPVCIRIVDLPHD